MKKYTKLAFVLCILLLASCSKKEKKYEKYFYGSFDTVIAFTAFTDSEAYFTEIAAFVEQRFQELHEEFDIYHEYEGKNNLYTINPIGNIITLQVSEDIIHLLLLSQEWYEKTEGYFNIYMGNVLQIWREFRENADPNALNNPLPELRLLKEVNTGISPEDLIVDEKAKTVFKKNQNMTLDIGGLAKGYACDIVSQELVEKGVKNFAINAGGDVIVGDKPKYTGDWSIGIENPDVDKKDVIDILRGKYYAVVTSGDYQRYYMADGKKIHHLINPKTLMPADQFKSVTVAGKETVICDILSTTLFVMDQEKGLALINSFSDYSALFVTQSDEIIVSDGFDHYQKKK